MVNFLLRDEKEKVTWRGQQCEYEGKDWSHVAPSQVMLEATRNWKKQRRVFHTVFGGSIALPIP